MTTETQQNTIKASTRNVERRTSSKITIQKQLKTEKLSSVVSKMEESK